MSFVRAGDMAMSYKPVMLKGMLTLADVKGEVELVELTSYFRNYYQGRADQGLPIETSRSIVNRIDELSDFDVTRLMLTMPFEKFERKSFMEHKRDLKRVAFVPQLWKSLTADDREELVKICDEQLDGYFENRVGG